MDKINFNKFIWLYWKMIFFLGGFPVAGMRKKNGVKKKKMLRRQLDGLLPI